MALNDLKQELQAINPDEMIEAVKATSFKIAQPEEGMIEEFEGLKQDYPGLATAVELMVAADMRHGRSSDEAWANAGSAIWGFLCLKHLVDTDELREIVEG